MPGATLCRMRQKHLATTHVETACSVVSWHLQSGHAASSVISQRNSRSLVGKMRQARCHWKSFTLSGRLPSASSFQGNSGGSTLCAALFTTSCSHNLAGCVPLTSVVGSMVSSSRWRLRIDLYYTRVVSALGCKFPSRCGARVRLAGPIKWSASFLAGHSTSSTTFKITLRAKSRAIVLAYGRPRTQAALGGAPRP